MALQGWKVELCERSEIVGFVEQWHYSHSMNGLKVSHCFKLLDNYGTLVGAAVFGKLSMANVWKRYAHTEEDAIELRRLCCVDDTPKNAESFLIGYALRWLRKNTDIKVCVSYADANQGHQGIIYQASNFKYVGMSSPGLVIELDGRTYHDRAIRTRYKGNLKPFAVRLKASLDSGEAVYKKTVGKHIYVYQLKAQSAK